MQTNDIVARLRVLNHHAKKLAENESLHDLYRDAFTRCENLTWEAADEIERLRKERDEARRRVCEDAIRNGRVYRRVGSDTVRCETSKEVAEMMGWKCFKENTND